MIDANNYRDAIQTALVGADPVDVPPMECTEMILLACAMEEFNEPTIIAVTWRRESLFYQHPASNPRGDGGADVGCLQLATTYWNKSPFIDGLNNPFGTTRTKTELFDGDPFENLRVGIRAYKQLLKRAGNDRGIAAGLYRAGHIDLAPGSSYLNRKAEFEGIAARYDACFNLLKSAT